MSLDKMIRIKLLTLSKKYDISLIEIKQAKDGKLKSSFTFNYQIKNDKSSHQKEWFNNKRELVSWLMCLE